MSGTAEAPTGSRAGPAVSRDMLPGTPQWLQGRHSKHTPGNKEVAIWREVVNREIMLGGCEPAIMARGPPDLAFTIEDVMRSHDKHMASAAAKAELLKQQREARQPKARTPVSDEKRALMRQVRKLEKKVAAQKDVNKAKAEQLKVATTEMNNPVSLMRWNTPEPVSNSATWRSKTQ